MAESQRGEKFSVTPKGRLQVRWSASDFKNLKKCAHYYNKTVLNPPNEYVRTTSVEQLFGTASHAALEAYDHAICEGNSQEVATNKALLKSYAFHDKLNFFEDSKRNSETLDRGVVWYIDQWKDDGYKTLILPDGSPGLEWHFEYVIPSTLYTTNGFIDRLVEDLNGNVYICERKTTGNTIDDDFFSRYNPDGQIDSYIEAVEQELERPVAGMFIDAHQVAVGFSKFVRSPVFRNSEQLDEWKAETLWWLGQAEKYHEEQFYPRNDAACYNCSLRKQCARPASQRYTDY